MKSYEHFFLGLYDAILSDVIDMYPTLRQSVGKDKARLLSLVEARGLSFLTIDLPELGKHLEQCLSSGTFTSPHLPGCTPGRRRGGIIPRLFSGIYLRIFDHSGMLRVDADVHAIRILRQLYYTAKKAKLECSDDRIQRAISEFYTVDRGVRSSTLAWEEDVLRGLGDDKIHFGYRRLDPLDDPSLLPETEQGVSSSTVSVDWERLNHIQNVCDIVATQLGFFDPFEWRTKHGPGAVADLRVGKDSKYEFPHWPSKLETSFPLADFAFANYSQWASDVSCKDGHNGRFSHHEPPSRLISVPKTQKGPRLIAAEPTCYQWTQQSVKDFLTERVRRTSIDETVRFRDQSRNQAFALHASRSQSHATIDLSSASDRVSCWHAERSFRRNLSLLRALHATRTRWIENSIDRRSPKYHALKKLSTMGSAVTFPVQTILFANIAIGALLHCRGIRVTPKAIRAASLEVRVFGDDIIVPTDVGASVLGALGDLGFKVNQSKTFVTGKFRESCGCDAYDGVDVTPTYTSTYPSRDRPESIVSSVAVRNNFFRNHYYKAAEYIQKTVMCAAPFLKVPNIDMDSGSFGWIEYCPSPNHHLKSRRKNGDSVLEYRMHTLQQRSKRLPDRESSRLLQYFTEDPSPMLKWESGVPSRPQILLNLRWEALDRGGRKATPILGTL